MQPSEGLPVPANEIKNDFEKNRSTPRAIDSELVSEPILEKPDVLREIDTLLLAATSRTPKPTNTLELLDQLHKLAEKMPQIVGHATGETISTVTLRPQDWEYLFSALEEIDQQGRNICQEYLYEAKATATLNPIKFIQRFLDKLRRSNLMEIYLPDQVLTFEQAELSYIITALETWLDCSTAPRKFPNGVREFLESLKKANSLSLYEISEEGDAAKEISTIDDPEILELLTQKIRTLPQAITQFNTALEQKSNFETDPKSLERLAEILPLKDLKHILTNRISERDGIDPQKTYLAYKVIENLLRLGLDRTIEIFEIPLKNIPVRPTGHRTSHHILSL